MAQLIVFIQDKKGRMPTVKKKQRHIQKIPKKIHQTSKMTCKKNVSSLKRKDTAHFGNLHISLKIWHDGLLCLVDHRNIKRTANKIGVN